MKKLYTSTAPATATATHSNFYSSFMRLPALRVLLILLMMVGVRSVGWGQTTYTFSSKSWAASPANWTSIKDGNQFTANQGIQVTTAAAGACGNSPISFANVTSVKVGYCTNSSTGVGTINVFSVANSNSAAQSGTRIGTSTSVSTSSGTTVRFLTFNTTSITGNIQIYVTCTTNSIYIYSVEITYSDSSPTITLDPTTLSGFSYVEGIGPSTPPQTFTVKGANLTADINIAATTNYEISKASGSGYTTPITFTPAEAVTDQTVYVRLKAGLAIGTYNGEAIIATSTDATDQTVTCNGEVTTPPAPDAPVAAVATAVTAAGFAANWNEVIGATGYELDVYTKVGSITTVLSENFNGFTAGTPDGGANTTDISLTLDTYTQTPGWTGSKVYQAGGTTKIGSSSVLGSIVTPEINLSGNSGNFNVSFEAMAWSGDATDLKIYLDDNLVYTATGLNNSTYTLSPYSINLSGGTSTSKIKFEGKQASKGRFFLENLVITQGSETITPIAGSPFTISVGASTSKTITGLEAITIYNYVVRATNTYGTSANSNEINVTTLNIPVPTAYNVTGTGSYCQGSGGRAVGLANSEIGVTYTLAPGGATVDGTGAAITFGNQLAGTYTVSGTNAGGTTAMTGSAVITERPLPTGAISGTATICEGSSTILSVALTGTPPWEINISDGSATPITISGISSSPRSISVSPITTTTYTLTAVSGLYCTGSVFTGSAEITVNPKPGVAGIISGSASVCQGPANVSYSVNEITNATGYTWNLPDGVTIVTGSNTRSITVNYSTSAVSGDITVYGTNVCGNGGISTPFAVTVNPLPAAAGSITGPITVIQGNTNKAYSISSIVNADSYIWSYTPSTGVTINGSGTNVTLDFGLTASNGQLKVKGHNDCGDGIESSLDITVYSSNFPEVFNVTGGGLYCASGAPNGIPVGLDGSESGVIYTLYLDNVAQVPAVTGTGTVITFGDKVTGTYTIKGENMNGTTTMIGSAINAATTLTPTATAGPDGFPALGNDYQLTGTAANYTSVLWSKTGGAGNGTLDGSATSANLNPVFVGTAVGECTINFTVTGYPGCGTASADVTLIVLTTSPITWVGSQEDHEWNNSGNWSPAAVPTASNDVVISGSPANSPTITGSTSPTAVCKDIFIASGNSLIGSELLTVNGTSTIQRTITGEKWHFISAPNENTYSGAFKGNFLQRWNEPTAEWSYTTGLDTKLDPVKGYSLWNKTSGTYSFTGAFLSGNQIWPISYNNLPGTTNDGANLLGNPYPCYIDWDGLRTDYGAVYYWNGSAYVTWNNGGAGSQFVAPMQGFFIIKGSGGPTDFNLTNINRAHSSSGTFYKSGSGISSNTLILQTEGESYSDKLFVVFDPTATEGFDLPKDAYKLLGYTEGVSELYSYTGDKKLSIDVRPESQVIQLGFTNTLSGEYQIGIDKIADIPVASLEDTKTSTFHDLLSGAYKFSYTAGEDDKRFLLHFGTTSVKENEKVSATIYSYQKTVYINMANQNKGDIFIYNITGQKVATRTSAQGMNEIKLAHTGNYIVKVISKNGTVVRKVFIQ